MLVCASLEISFLKNPLLFVVLMLVWGLAVWHFENTLTDIPLLNDVTSVLQNVLGVHIKEHANSKYIRVYLVIWTLFIF